MGRLPNMRYSSGIRRSIQNRFGGLDHTEAAENGDIYDMLNLSSDCFPLISVRASRGVHELSTNDNVLGLCGHDRLYVLCGDFLEGPEPAGEGTSPVTGTRLKYIGDDDSIKSVSMPLLSDGEKHLCGFGDYIIILPDKYYYNVKTAEHGYLESSIQIPSGKVTYGDGYLYGEEAKKNAIISLDSLKFSDYFNEGDAIEICDSKRPTINKTYIIREFDSTGTTIHLDEYSLDTGSDEQLLETNAITIKRAIPDLDFICENENRLWGCKGSTVYASKLGDPFNWNCFDGLSTDSYAVNVGSTGDFTGCCSFMSYPIFFKEDNIYKLYGDKPSNFQLMATASQGVKSGAHRSIAIAGDYLFYQAPSGICVYTGGMPKCISSCFGNDNLNAGVGGSDGIKYYFAPFHKNGSENPLYVYDTRYGLWYKEDNPGIRYFAKADGVLCFSISGGIGNDKIQCTSLSDSTHITPTTENTEWSCEFADIYEQSSISASKNMPERKGIIRLYIRYELKDGATLTASIKYNGGEWEQINSVKTGNGRSAMLPIIPRRADHYRVKLEGVGGCIIYSVTREFYTGSFI